MKNVNDWISDKGLETTVEPWSIFFTVTTTNIEHWLYSRNKLQDDHVKLELKLSHDGRWLATLERKDGLYVVQWRPDKYINIEAQQLKYRRMIKWPELCDLESFGQFIKDLENILDIKFEPHLNVGGHIKIDEKIYNSPDLLTWLEDCIDTVGVNMSAKTSKPKKKDNAKPPRAEVPREKYLIRQPDEDSIELTDFNFKLSIIQELMYTKQVLKPMFDLREFVDWYLDRRIDLEKEGFDFIPEVTSYFMELPIPISLAEYVDEIYQDGGNEIYRAMFYFNNGEGSDFNIKTAADAKHFPKLKSVTLCYAEPQVYEEFEALNIEAIEG